MYVSCVVYYNDFWHAMQNPEDNDLKPESMDIQVSPTHQSFASPASPLTRVSHVVRL